MCKSYENVFLCLIKFYLDELLNGTIKVKIWFFIRKCAMLFNFFGFLFINLGDSNSI